MRELLARAAEGERLKASEAVILYETADFFDLLSAAQAARFRLHPERVVTFVVDRNVNYSNVCVSGCLFCAFYRPPGHPEAYVLPKAVILEKVRELAEAGGTQLLLQGGFHPELGIGFFEDLFRSIRKEFPTIQIHSLSAPEILYLARREKLPVGTVLGRLREAGLASLPGGGAEILVDRLRRRLSPRKFTSAEWLGVMAEAHRQGMRSTATMVFGLGETLAERVEHLEKIRSLQDETGGFTAFIPWSFQPRNTALEGSLEPEGGIAYLRLLAISRLFLDNIPNLQASWVTQGGRMAAMALLAGANDLGGTMMEENVVRAAGVSYRLSVREVVDIIRRAGFEPVQRDTLYNERRRYPEDA